MNKYNEVFNQDNQEDFNIREQIEKYLIHWKWFFLSVVLCLVFAFLYLKYVTPKYSASATILVKDEKNGGGLSSELSALSDLGGLGTAKGNVDNEIEILKSRTLISETVQELDLNISYFANGKFKKIELYKDSPVKIIFFPSKSTLLSNKIDVFKVVSVNATSFRLLYDDKEIGVFKYNSIVETRVGKLSVAKTVYAAKKANEEFEIDCVYALVEKTAQSFKSVFKVNTLNKTSSVVELSIVDAVPSRAEDFLNTLVNLYNQKAIEDKNLVAEKTSEFISKRLEFITSELSDVEKNVEGFKNQNSLTDIESETKLFLENASDYEKQKIETEIQLNVIASMISFLKTSKSEDLIPTNILSFGDNSEASSLIGEYNKMVIERNRIASGATLENPVVQNADKRLNALKSNIAQSLSRMQSSLEIKKRNLDQERLEIGGRKAQVPRLEREFRIIDRQQKVKEALYLYLLQKREETALTLAATEQNAKVIDAGLSSEVPVSPKKIIIYLAALIAGLLLPFLIIYISDLLDTKIKSRLDIEGKTMIPFIGDVPSSDSPNEIMQSESRTSSAEALRIIRTNLEFMLSKVPENKAKTIFLTSTFPKEGKTFVSVNLAATFALSGKKVLLVGMDIRNPRLDDYLNLPDRGVTNYLSSKDLILDDLIVKQSGYEDFYVLPAGVIPPNPAELLMGKKVNQLFEDLKNQFDYIIVDTAPVGLVTDTLLITKHADCFIYVARANVLEKRMLAIPNGLYKDNKLPNMCMLLNDTDSTKGYGYGYGYGVNMEVKPWYKDIFKI